MEKNTFACGVDLGWVSQLESLGYSWVDDAGARIDPILACRNMGANAVRLRTFVDPPKSAFWQKRESELVMLGFCDTDHVLEMAGRVREMEMDLMIDIHLSDHFSDPVFQDIPEAWKGHDGAQLTEDVYEHLKHQLSRFRDWDLVPRWVQVGNEINNGVLWPTAALAEDPSLLVRILNRGFDAVKEVFPECQVVTHLAGINDESRCVPFLDNFFSRGGKTDQIGFSYYPYWDQFESDADTLYGWLFKYEQAYDRPVLIAEVGGEDEDEQESFRTVRDCIEALQRLPDKRGRGVFYWEPDVNRSAVPDGYPLGACVPAGEKVLRFNRALLAYQK